jgi:hypothetical protein
MLRGVWLVWGSVEGFGVVIVVAVYILIWLGDLGLCVVGVWIVLVVKVYLLIDLFVWFW